LFELVRRGEEEEEAGEEENDDDGASSRVEASVLPFPTMLASEEAQR
jgi:hypothetical protein